MNMLVKCPTCDSGYNLDLDRYGGKNVRCKKCQGIISVPSPVEDIEVVKEAEVTPEAHHRGVAYFENGDYERAIAEFTEATIANPDFAESYY